jgi:hypothetical protein
VLSSAPFCDACSRYMSKRGHFERYSADPHSISALKKDFKELASSGRVQAAVGRHAEFGAPKSERAHRAMAQLRVHHCGNCSTTRLALATKLFDGKKEWKQVGEELVFDSQEPVTLG